MREATYWAELASGITWYICLSYTRFIETKSELVEGAHHTE